MKKTIILLLLVISITNIQAQKNLPYKPLAEFKNDTTAFVLYNFMDRADQYKGKKLVDVVKDLEIPIKELRPELIKSQTKNKPMIAIETSIYIQDRNYRRKIHRKNLYLDFYSIDIEWNEMLEPKEESRKKIPTEDIDSYNQFTIKDISVSIPRSSKYFEKYKPKETKLADDINKSEFLIDENGELILKYMIIN